MVRTAVKAVRSSIEAKDAVKAKKLLVNAEKVLDSSASKKVYTRMQQREQKADFQKQ